MARKNMFEGITPAAAPPQKDPATPPRVASSMPEVFQQGGPIAAIRNDLRSMGSRSVQEIDPALIDDSDLKDRIGDLDTDIAELRDSIARHGQQVPVLLRPHPTLSGRYQVVYGRRRLAAIRGLGRNVKALIRTLSDEEAVLAQGQENNLRKDPSFIEKALFAGDLEKAGYEPRVIQDALNVSRSHTSHMRKVRECLPREVIERIGPAPSVGWKRWYGLATLIQDQGLSPMQIHPAPFPSEMSSDQRFEAWAKAASVATRKPRAPRVDTTRRIGLKARDGAVLGTLSVAQSQIGFQAEPQAADFAAWIGRNAEALFQRLHTEFLGQKSPND